MASFTRFTKGKVTGSAVGVPLTTNPSSALLTCPADEWWILTLTGASSSSYSLMLLLYSAGSYVVYGYVPNGGKGQIIVPAGFSLSGTNGVTFSYSIEKFSLPPVP